MSRKTSGQSVNGGYSSYSMNDVDRFGILGDGSDGQPRKRRRLTHLTPEERMMRRKLKNRVAAQTARDRKKARMAELEALVAELEEENQLLINENKDLENKTLSLEEENELLKERLGVVNGNSEVNVKVEPMSTESAEFRLVTQQKGQALVHYLKTTRCLTLLMTLSLIYFLGSSNNSKEQRQTKLNRSRSITHLLQQTSPITTARLLRWWGPQQRNWNPSMNS